MPQPIHVHFENLSTNPDVFLLTPPRVAAACTRYPDVGAAIAPTFGYDFRDLAPQMRTAEVLVTFEVPRDAVQRDRAPNLKLIHISGAGVDHLLPMNWLPPGLSIANCSGAHSAKVREYTMMSLLMLNARIPALATAKEQKRWQQLHTPVIAGKTALVVGLGGVGAAAAAGAKALGLRVVGIRRSREPHPAVDEMHGPADLDTLLPHADFVVMAAPLTSTTRHMIGPHELSLMRPQAGLINVGRGPVIDQAAVAGALCSGRLAGAVLDVFEREPIPTDSPLWSTPNLVITPHVSADDGDLYPALVLDIIFDNLRRYANGQTLNNRVDPTREY